jgi:CubicO group peptidase (beta-lactamase class C family)
LIVAACNGSQATTTIETATSTSTAPATTTVEPLVECPEIPYRVPGLPERVAGEAADFADIELDEFTAIGGTRSVFWVDSEGSLTVALVRGALPPKPFPGDQGEIEIADTLARVGPFEDGKWVAAWFVGNGERCDLYTMVFYPPIEPAEVETALLSITKSP